MTGGEEAPRRTDQVPFRLPSPGFPGSGAGRLTCMMGWAILPGDFLGRKKYGRGEAGISRGGWR